MPFYARTVWATGPPAEVESASAGHREQLRTLHAAGRLLAAGEFPDGGGFLEIFEATDRLEAERVARASPLVGEGLGSWTLREWTRLDLG